ncbi:MAG: transposase family protein [Tannerella sp.]|nr:transposase family protein [Tannerella sp.]
MIAIFTYLSNGEDYEDMVLFARNHKTFLQPYTELPNGIPSHDTFRRVISARL